MLGLGFLASGRDPNQVEVLWWHESSTVFLIVFLVIQAMPLDMEVSVLMKRFVACRVRLSVAFLRE